MLTLPNFILMTRFFSNIPVLYVIALVSREITQKQIQNKTPSLPGLIGSDGDFLWWCRLRWWNRFLWWWLPWWFPWWFPWVFSPGTWMPTNTLRCPIGKTKKSYVSIARVVHFPDFLFLAELSWGERGENQGKNSHGDFYESFLQEHWCQQIHCDVQ